MYFYIFPTEDIPASYDGSGFVASLTVPKLTTVAQSQCTTSLLKLFLQLGSQKQQTTKWINQTVITIASFPKYMHTHM